MWKVTRYGMNTYPVWTLYFRDEWGATLVRYGNRAEISLVLWQQKPYLLWFTCHIAIAIQYSVNTAIKKEHDYINFVMFRFCKYRKIPKKITSGTYFSKAFLKALIFWGTYKFGGKFVLEIYVSKSIGLSYSSDSWKEIYVSSLQKIFTETRLEDVHISKTQPFLCLCGPSQEWRVNYENSNKLWHFLTAIIWHT